MTFVVRSVVAVVILAFAIAGHVDTSLARAEKTCADFDFQEEAQEYYDAGGGRATDTYIGMDGNNNGIACESLPLEPRADASLSTFIAPTAVTVAVVAGGIWWTRRRKATPSTTNTEKPTVTPVSSTAPITINVNTSAESSSIANAKSVSTSGLDDEWMTPEKARAMPYADYLRSRYWQTVRRNNIARANGACRDCGRTDQVLHVHHLSYEYLGREDDRFLVVLCADCHEKRHDIPAPPGAGTT